MKRMHLTDAQIADAVRSHVPEHAAAGLRERISEAVDATGQQRPVPALLAALFDADQVARRRSLLVAVALLLIAALAAGAAVGALRIVEDNRARDLTWGPERANQDWPGRVRAEPAGGAPVVFARVTDPTGDLVPTIGEIDITEVLTRKGCWMSLTAEACVYFDVATRARSYPHPRSAWIAYGIVVDNNGDGRPDLRFGIDNAAANPLRGRMWRTDLASGKTLANSRSLEDPFVMDAGFPMRPEPDPQEMGSNGHIFVRHPGPEFRFYVWASEIVDGRVVATDYAPDFGWIE